MQASFKAFIRIFKKKKKNNQPHTTTYLLVVVKDFLDVKVATSIGALEETGGLVGDLGVLGLLVLGLPTKGIPEGLGLLLLKDQLVLLGAELLGDGLGILTLVASGLGTAPDDKVLGGLQDKDIARVQRAGNDGDLHGAAVELGGAADLEHACVAILEVLVAVVAVLEAGCLAASVHNHLALEEQVKVWGLLVLDNTDQAVLLLELVAKSLGPDGRGALLVLQIKKYGRVDMLREREAFDKKT